MDQPTDVFSLSDHLLAERLQFVKEIGFGNWGSVWLCRPKSSSGKARDIEVAVKLVHRSKTSTTAARVRSLWNEMKIVRSFKNDPHPSIVPFHSFIITPSYALITMAYLPTPVPVEVSESRARVWFKSLLSGVHFLHSRGVVHNDIKPANILLSRANVPVLVDFGFAERYDLASPKAFHSNLTYGTPEYLSPERARGLPHDTRRSDIWSLGVTFFEILVGRTPFEHEEGEVFEKKEDLEKYWHRTMRGKWVGKYSMSQAVECFLRRMIVPNADLRCTAAELVGDAYWDVAPPAPVHGHRKSASATTPSTAQTRLPLVFDSFRHAFKDKEKEASQSRRLDMSLPWSASRSGSRASASRPASRTEWTPRSASGMGTSSRPVSRAESTPKMVSGTPSSSHSQRAELPASNRHATVEHVSSDSASPAVRTRTHSRSRSQPKLRAPPGLSTPTRTRKLSTVQASPLVRSQRRINLGTESGEERDVSVRKGREAVDTRQKPTLVSLSSETSLKRPLGPRQPSPHVPSITGVTKEVPVPLARARITEEKRAHSHIAQYCTPQVDRTRAHVSHQPVTPQTPTHALATQTPVRATKASPSASKQLSGKPPRTRGRAGVLADLTGFARNVDLSAHGVPRHVHAAKKDRGKEDTKSRTTSHKQNKENEGLPLQVHSPRKVSRVSNGLAGATPLSPKTPAKEPESTVSMPLSANLSSATKVTRGSVRDRMMDWERERERLREMERLADAGSTIGTTTTTSSDSSDDDDSGVEAEVAAEVASAQTKGQLLKVEARQEEKVKVEGEQPGAAQSVTTLSSLSSNMERSQIAVAKLGVRASAQILSSQNGSISVLALNNQSVGKLPSEGSPAKRDSVTDVGLPVEVQRNGESGFSSLKHSVKASIDKSLRFYKSSTLALTGRATPAWCASPEPIDFEQRRSGEEGRFSWEDIRPEREVAVDRMNTWIQSVERVVEETCQNFASTSITPPPALPLAPMSRSSSLHHGNTVAPASQNNNNTLHTSRSSRFPRRLLAANEIFAESQDLNAPLLPAISRGEGSSASFSCIHTPESSVPVLPTISVFMQTPQRRGRRATISTGTPEQEKKGSGSSGIFDHSPSKRREKSKSQSNLDRHIQDVSKLELELNKVAISSPPPRLSAVLDRSLFVAPPLSPRFTEDSTTSPGTSRGRSIQFDDLNSSPYYVESYPARKSAEKDVLASPDKRHLEGVYDRFLMATSGVKRVGKGYQSDNPQLVQNTVSTPEPPRPAHARGFGVFGAGKRPMPPPVSSDDAWRRSPCADEFGFLSASQGTHSSSSRSCRDDSKRTFVHRAIKAMVPGRTASRRPSRTIVV